MDPVTIAAIIGGGVGLASNLVGTLSDYNVSQKNLNRQEAQLSQELKMWQTSMAREDSSVQRRVADLKAAGLSPVLAAGSGASTQSPIKLTTPQRDFKMSRVDPIQSVATALGLVKSQADVSQTAAQTELIKAQTESKAIENKFDRNMNPLKLSEKALDVLFKEDTLDERIALVSANVKTVGLKQANLQLDNQLKVLAKDKTELDIALKKVEAEYAKMESHLAYEKGQKELIIKHLTVDYLKLKNELTNLDWQFFKKTGIPPSTLGAGVSIINSLLK